MELTGKCKEDFENAISYTLVQSGMIKQVDEFYMFPSSMQYGVYVDFFDSVGIYISIEPYQDYDSDIQFWCFNIKGFNIIELNTRNEARTEAIKKANEIYNLK